MCLFQDKVRLFFVVNAIASIGLNLGIVGVNWFIIDVTRQNSVLGWYGAVSLISAFLTLAWSSTLTDKYNKMSILKYCCFGQAVIFVLTGIFYYLQVPVLWIIYILSVLNMPLIVLFSTVSRGAVRVLWDQNSLSKGNSALEITIQIGAMAAALLTGLLYGYAGFSLLILTGAFLTAVAGILLSCGGNCFDYVLPGKEDFWHGLFQGFSYLCKHKYEFALGLAAFIPTIVISSANTVIPGYVEQTLQQGPFVYGIGDICFAVGALVAGLLMPVLLRHIKESRLSPWLALVVCITLGILMISRNKSAFFACILVSGLSLAGLRILLNTALMKSVHEHFLGRVLSLLMALSIFLQALLSFYIGKMMDAYGAQRGYVPLVLLTTVCLFFLLCRRKRVSE